LYSFIFNKTFHTSTCRHIDCLVTFGTYFARICAYVL